MFKGQEATPSCPTWAFGFAPGLYGSRCTKKANQGSEVFVLVFADATLALWLRRKTLVKVQTFRLGFPGRITVPSHAVHCTSMITVLVWRLSVVVKFA